MLIFHALYKSNVNLVTETVVWLLSYHFDIVD